MKKSISSSLVIGETQAFQPLPILVGQPSLGVWPSRTGVPLISHVIVALGLSSALNTSLQWLKHGEVLRLYSVFKVQLRGLTGAFGRMFFKLFTNPFTKLEKNRGYLSPPSSKFF